MISTADLERYISTIPPLPKVVKSCSDALENGDLVGAADEASKDSALMLYLRQLVNKPIFGFRSTIKDPRQLFGILGLSRARQLLYAYYTQLLLPQKWEVFDLNTRIFQEFQAHIMVKWEKLMSANGADDEDVLKVASILPATLAVCEEVFKDRLETLRLIQSQRSISYDVILFKMTGLHFLDIAAKIAQKWELPEVISQMLLDVGSDEPRGDLVEYLKLLIQYELSRPVLIQSGANDFFELNIFASEEMVSKFYSIVEEVESATNN
jgi:HD-like signal output (HDOD) protein